MRNNKELIDKVALIDWNVYVNNCKEDFVLDEEEDWELLASCFSEIQDLDTNLSIYACTYYITEKSFYCDNIWLKTQLAPNQVIEIFSRYRSIEPYYIELLSDEKDNVDVFVDSGSNYYEFKKVCDEFNESNTLSIFWD